MAGEKQTKIGRINEMKILALLREKPRTPKELMVALTLCKSMIQRYLARMSQEPKRIYISGHAPKPRGTPSAIYSIGDKPDVEYIPNEIRSAKITPKQRKEQAIELLSVKPDTMLGLANRMFITSRGLNRYMTQLRQEGRVYIFRWMHPREVRPDSNKGGDWTPMYAVGDLPDEPRPKCETSSERHHRLHKSAAYRKQRREARKDQTKREKSVSAAKALGAQSWFSTLVNIPKESEHIEEETA